MMLKKTVVFRHHQRSQQFAGHLIQRHQFAVFVMGREDTANVLWLQPHQWHLFTIDGQPFDTLVAQGQVDQCMRLWAIPEIHLATMNTPDCAVMLVMPRPRHRARLIIGPFQLRPQLLSGQQTAGIQQQRARIHPCRQRPLFAVELPLYLSIKKHHPDPQHQQASKTKLPANTPGD